jgi:uncharacterized protein (TIGR02246 family)
MKLIRILLVCASLSGTVRVVDAQGPREDQAIRKVLRDFHDALNARDFKKFGECLADDAEFVNVTATLAKGRDEIVKMHERALNVVYKGIDFKALEANTPEPVVTIRFIRPDVAIVHSQIAPGDSQAAEAAAAAMHMQKPGKDSRQVVISVLSKHGDKWLIDSAQNTVWGLAPTAPK